MADINTLFKVLNFINAATSDDQLGKDLDNKIKGMFEFLSPDEKKEAQEAIKEKKKGMRHGGKVYSKGSGHT
jgi:hypothetical protein